MGCSSGTPGSRRVLAWIAQVTFLDRYQDLPLVTIGGRLENRPDSSIDNYQGVHSTVEHLIKVHNRKHIAMIRAP